MRFFQLLTTTLFSLIAYTNHLFGTSPVMNHAQTLTVSGSWTVVVTNSGIVPPPPAGNAVTIEANGSSSVSASPTTDLSPSTFDFPYGVAIHPDGTTAYVVNANDSKVSAIDIPSNTVIATAPIGNTGNFIAINTLGTRAYVTNKGDSTITILNIAGLNKQHPIVANTIFSDSTQPSSPTGIAISFDNSTLYVINEGSSHLVAFSLSNPDSPAIIATATIPSPGDFFNYIAVTPDNKKLYISNQSSNVIYSYSLPLTNGETFLNSITLPTSEPSGMAITKDGNTLYVVNQLFTSTAEQICVVDTTFDALVQTITISNGGVGTQLSDIVLTPDDHFLYATDALPSGHGLVWVVDITNPDLPTVVGSISTLEPNPRALAITPDQAPHAVLTATVAPAGSPTVFDGSASSSPVGSIASYVWDFADGTPPITTSSPTITHTYASSGTFFVTLTVTNTAGTSTTQIFPTGQTLSNNGNLDAFAVNMITVPPPPPTATGLTPNSGPTSGGQTVTISGTNFTCVESVQFGTQAACIVSVSPSGNSITVTTPPSSIAGNVPVTITTCGGSTTVPGGYTYLPPTITSFSPRSGPASGGTVVTILGTDLFSIQDVKFGDVLGCIINISPSGTSITVVSPPHCPGRVPLIVQTPNFTLKAGDFTYKIGCSHLVCPPRHLKGKQKTSSNHCKIINTLTWQAPECNDCNETPCAYRIFSNSDLSGPPLAEIPAHNCEETFIDRTAKKGKTTYYIVSVDRFENQSAAAHVTVGPHKTCKHHRKKPS